MYSPSQPAKGSSTNMRVIASSASSTCSRLRARSTPKPPSSAADDDSPVPNSTRPSETRSSVAMRSATRAGWLYRGRQLHDAVPEPDALRALRAAARNTSGADECEYSSRKWCSTSQT